MAPEGGAVGELVEKNSPVGSTFVKPFVMKVWSYTLALTPLM